MVIKKQPVISWLLSDRIEEFIGKLKIAETDNPMNNMYLFRCYTKLAKIRAAKPKWGVPELVMPSFERAMEKGEAAFQKVWAQLFNDFSQQSEGGIIVSKLWNGTIIYGFGDNRLFIWLYNDLYGESYLRCYCEAYVNSSNQIVVEVPYEFATDPSLFSNPDGTVCNHLSAYVVDYVSLKKYAPVEKIIVANNTIAKIDSSDNKYNSRQRIRNESGQEVIVMDSRWFTKIINDNDIVVRGFFRLQNKKNKDGEWIKELIYVDSFVRHGYHRNAKIEDEIE